MHVPTIAVIAEMGRRFMLLLFLSLLVSLDLRSQTLVAHYPFSGDASDVSGAGNNGTVYGATLTTDRFGNLNSAYSFNGSSNYIEVAHSSSLNFGNSSDFTLAAWVKFAGAQTTYAGIVCKGPTGTFYPGIQLVVVGTSATALVSTNTGSYVQAQGGDISASGCIGWHHVVCEVSGTNSNVKLYVDGSLVSQTSSSIMDPSYNNTRPLLIGAERNKSVFFRGAIDDIRIYNGLLSTSQIQSLYSENNWPPISQPVNLSLSALDPVTICRGDSVRLRARGGNHYQWTPILGLNDATSPDAVARPAVTTTYRIKAFGPTDCDTASSSVTVTVLQPPEIAGGLVSYICQGDSIAIGADATGTDPPFTYEWTPAAGLSNAAVSHPTASPITTTWYHIRVTNSRGCSTTDSTLVNVMPAFTVNAGRDTTICRGTPLRIGPNPLGQYRYHWSPASGLSDTAAAQPEAVPDTTTRYFLVATSPTGCKAYDTIVVKVNPPASAEAGTDRTICADSSAIIGTPPQTGYTYDWTPPTGLRDSHVAQPTANPTVTTTYHVTATNSSGCSSTDSVTVTVLHARVEASSMMLDFGLLDGCTSNRELTLKLSNNGDVPISISEAISDNPGFSAVGPMRPIMLAVGDTVTITVRYAPTAAGPASGKLTFSGDPCGVAFTLDLKGSKQQSDVSADVSSIEFGRGLSCQNIDTSAEITISNHGMSDAVVGAVPLTAPFSIISPSLPTTLAAGGVLKVHVGYRPTGAGAYSSDMKFPYTSGSCLDTIRVLLNGLVERPKLMTGQGGVDFGTLGPCDVGRDTTITITNGGTYDITIDSISIPDNFGSTTGWPLVIPAGQVRTISLRFEPSTRGGLAGLLTLHYQPCNATDSIELRGTKQGGSFALPDSIDFGDVLSCREDSKTLSATILYSGDVGTIGSVAGVNISGPFTTTLKAGDPLTNGSATGFNVTFIPTQDGLSTGSMDVTLQPCGIMRRIAFSGNHTTIALVPSSLTFGTRTVGTSATKMVMFINSSSVPITIGQVDGIALPFSITSTVPAVPATLQPGDTLHILVRYDASPGISRDTLHAVVTDPCNIGVVATLDGTGEDDASTIVSLPVTEAVPGEGITLPITLASSGDLDLIGAHRFTMDVAFNRKLLFPIGSTPVGTEQGWARMVTVTGMRPPGMASGELARLEFTAALGDTNYTPIEIRSFRWLDANAAVETRDGGVTIRAQNGWNLFLSNGKVRLLVRPNPATERGEILYEVIEPGRTTLTVRDAIGREIGRLLDADVKPGSYSISQDVGALAAGVYYYVLRTPGVQIIAPLVVVH